MIKRRPTTTRTTVTTVLPPMDHSKPIRTRHHRPLRSTNDSRAASPHTGGNEIFGSRWKQSESTHTKPVGAGNCNNEKPASRSNPSAAVARPPPPKTNRYSCPKQIAKNAYLFSSLHKEDTHFIVKTRQMGQYF